MEITTAVPPVLRRPPPSPRRGALARINPAQVTCGALSERPSGPRRCLPRRRELDLHQTPEGLHRRVIQGSRPRCPSNRPARGGERFWVKGHEMNSNHGRYAGSSPSRSLETAKSDASFASTPSLRRQSPSRRPTRQQLEHDAAVEGALAGVVLGHVSQPEPVRRGCRQRRGREIQLDRVQASKPAEARGAELGANEAPVAPSLVCINAINAEVDRERPDRYAVAGHSDSDLSGSPDGPSVSAA